jgi:translation initiation factor 1
MRPQKKKIETGAVQPGLNAAFSQLELAGLPTGPVPEAAPEPASAAAAPPVPRKLGRVVLRREKAHRGGKTVIVVHDFPTHLTPRMLEELAKKLRTSCGCGGTVKGREIEMQGDQPGKIRAVLEREGFQAAGVS